MDTPSIGIGSIVWVFDRNHRVYKRDAAGRNVGGAIYREHFRPTTIVEDTPRSWVLASGRKIPKNSGTRCEDVYLTQAEVDEACWLDAHAWRIQEAAGRVRDPATLRQIAALVGYDDKAGQ